MTNMHLDISLSPRLLVSSSAYHLAICTPSHRHSILSRLYRSSANRREWLYVTDHCRAIDLILRHGKAGELYNIGSGVEQSVEQITDRILALLDKAQHLKTYVPDRPGHDRRYLLNSGKLRRELGWSPAVGFEEGMHPTVAWYVENERWWRPLQAQLAVAESNWKP